MEKFSPIQEERSLSVAGRQREILIEEMEKRNITPGFRAQVEKLFEEPSGV